MDALLQPIALAEPVLDRSHPDLIRVHLALARVYDQLKDWTAASTSAARAREITETRLSPGHPLMAEILGASASIPRKTGHSREARDLRRQANAITAALPKDPASQARTHVADLMLSGYP